MIPLAKKTIVVAFQPVLGMKALPWSGIVLNPSGVWVSCREGVNSKRVCTVMVKLNI